MTPATTGLNLATPLNVAEGQALSLTPEMRAFLLHGPRAKSKLDRDTIRHGGAATVLVQWRRHREELLDACPPGRRPWAYWMVERRFERRPSGELGELRAISQLCLYRDAAEVEYVERRLRELGRQRYRGRRHDAGALRVA